MPTFAIDPESARFLNTAYEAGDWLALFLKSYDTGQVAQRVGPLSWALSHTCQSWLRTTNGRRFNVYVSVNAIAAGRRARTRDAIASIRHLFLEADHDGDGVLSAVCARPDIPAPSYVLHSSPGRLHLFWRATRFEPSYLERLQKQLAVELATDLAATPITQTTRLPGFLNQKHSKPHLVRIEYRDTQRRYAPDDFPALRPDPSPAMGRIQTAPLLAGAPVVERARRYLALVPPAVTGEHGDLHTFRVCCSSRGACERDSRATCTASRSITATKSESRSCNAGRMLADRGRSSMFPVLLLQLR